MRSILVFGSAGLVGPLLELTFGTESSALHRVAATLWPMWGLAAWEATISPVLAATIAVAANVLLFGIGGAIAGIHDAPVWKGVFGVSSIAGLWFLNSLLDGSFTEFLIVAAVWIAALVLTIVPSFDQGTD